MSITTQQIRIRNSILLFWCGYIRATFPQVYSVFLLMVDTRYPWQERPVYSQGNRNPISDAEFLPIMKEWSHLSLAAQKAPSKSA